MTAITMEEYSRNHWSKRLVLSKWFWTIFILMGFSLPIYKSLNRKLPPPLPKIYKVPEFSFTNQFGKKFGSKDLKGKPYIASFFFTSCPTTCPGLMKKLQKVQKRVRGVGQKLALVSFTVDPEFDTAKVLEKHFHELNGNPYIWSFLRSNPQETRSLLVDGFKVPMGEKEEVDGYKVNRDDISVFDIAHTEKLVLVGPEGFVRGYYPLEKVSIDKLMVDIGLMVNKLHYKKD